MFWFQLLLNETSENTFVSFPIVHIYVKTVAYVDTTDVAANIAGVLGGKITTKCISTAYIYNACRNSTSYF